MSIVQTIEDKWVSAAFDLGFVTGTLHIAISKAELADWCDEKIEANHKSDSTAAEVRRMREKSSKTCATL